MYFQLVVSVVILVAYVAGCVAVHLRLNHLDRRRAARAQMRRVNRYRAAAPDTGRVVYLDNYSRKVAA